MALHLNRQMFFSRSQSRDFNLKKLSEKWWQRKSLQKKSPSGGFWSWHDRWSRWVFPNFSNKTNWHLWGPEIRCASDIMICKTPRQKQKCQIHWHREITTCKPFVENSMKYKYQQSHAVSQWKDLGWLSYTKIGEVLLLNPIFAWSWLQTMTKTLVLSAPLEALEFSKMTLKQTTTLGQKPG